MALSSWGFVQLTEKAAKPQVPRSSYLGFTSTQGRRMCWINSFCFLGVESLDRYIYIYIYAYVYVGDKKCVTNSNLDLLETFSCRPWYSWTLRFLGGENSANFFLMKVIVGWFVWTFTDETPNFLTLLGFWMRVFSKYESFSSFTRLPSKAW